MGGVPDLVSSIDFSDYVIMTDVSRLLRPEYRFDISNSDGVLRLTKIDNNRTEVNNIPYLMHEGRTYISRDFYEQELCLFLQS